MDLSMKKSTELFEYRHKKFDTRKRPREEENQADGHSITNQRIIPLAHQQQPAISPKLYAVAERVGTPESNCSSDYGGFTRYFNAASTPQEKRRRLLSANQYSTASGSPSEDSGISLATTPRRMLENQKRRELKSKLNPSALSAEINGKCSATKVNAEVTIPQTVIDLAVKNASKINISPIGTDIKAALEPALKPTKAGTLELITSTTADVAVAHTPTPITAATLLSRISEDKLRSICAFHGNMVRTYPKKERTAKDQERRERNTIACRMHRRLKKLEDIAVEMQFKENEREYMKLLEEWLRMQAFAENLTQVTMGGCEQAPEIDVLSFTAEKNGGIAIKRESLTNGM